MWQDWFICRSEFCHFFVYVQEFLKSRMSSLSETLSRSACVITGGLAEAVNLADALRKGVSALDMVRMGSNGSFKCCLWWQQNWRASPVYHYVFLYLTRIRLLSYTSNFPINSMRAPLGWPSGKTCGHTSNGACLGLPHSATFLPVIFSPHPQPPPLTLHAGEQMPPSL